jgi:hypothetical protein
MTTYPAQIDNNVTLPLVEDNQSPIGGDTVNRLRDAIIAIENELGAKPSGTFATVRSRMDRIENLITQQVVTIAGDLGGTPSHPLVIGLQDRPLSSAAPLPNQVIGWNGIVWQPTNSVQLAQDLGNTHTLPYVTGLQGRPVSTQAPTSNQVLTWDGYIWKPVTQSVTLNILPTVILLPVDIVFVGGDGYTNSSSPFRVGARAVDMSPFPSTTLDGRTRTMTFKADLEVTNAAATGFVRIKDVTNNVVITSSTLSTSSLTSVELSANINSGVTPGLMRTDMTAQYEVQIFITGGGANDQVICRNARINIVYSPPVLITTLLALAMPSDINFVSGTEMNGFSTPAGTGGREVDITLYPALLTDNSGRARSMTFKASLEVSSVGVDGYCRLFDTTHNVAVTNTLFQFNNTVTTEYTSIPLVVGTSPGNIRSDAPTRYEVQIWKTSGSVTDRVICNNARITIVYS